MTCNYRACVKLGVKLHVCDTDMSHSSLCVLLTSCSLWHFSSLFRVCYTFDEIYTFTVENGTILHVSRLHSPNKIVIAVVSETGKLQASKILYLIHSVITFLKQNLI